MVRELRREAFQRKTDVGTLSRHVSVDSNIRFLVSPKLDFIQMSGLYIHEVATYKDCFSFDIKSARCSTSYVKVTEVTFCQ